MFQRLRSYIMSKNRLQFSYHLQVFCCLIYLITPVFSARILGIFPLESRSHFAFNEAIMRALGMAGHQVTIVGPYNSSYYASHNITHISSKNEKSGFSVTMTQAADSWLTIVTHAINLLEEDCYRVMSLKEIQALEDFDVMFVEALPMAQCYFPIAKKLGIPIIGTSAHRAILYADHRIANPRIPAVFPNEGIYIHGEITFYKRLCYFVDEILSWITFVLEERKVKQFYQSLFPEQAPIDFDFSWLFINNFANLEPRPLVSNAVNIGGIHVKLAKLNPLPKPLKTFIEEDSEGVILFSLGSIVSLETLSSAKLDALKNAFAKIPQRVIWSINGSLDGLSKNVWTGNWLPQKEILAHDKVLAFISHCGVSSMYEAIYFGKPVIPVPHFADQINNAGVLVTLGAAPHFSFEELTEINLLEAINKVIYDEKYRKNMELLSQKFKDELNSPAEKVVYWTEYILRYNGSLDLRSKAVGMPLYQYLLLDVITLTIVSIATLVFLISLIIKYAMKRIFGLSKSSDHSMNKKMI